MIEVSKCVICDKGIRRLKRALVAPFLATRIWDRPPFCVDLVECGSCGFLFYNPRLDTAEEGRLYANYRSGEYVQMRNASEPWYTSTFNADLASPASYQARRAMVGGILRQHLGTRPVKRVLDFGGDRGDLVLGLVDGAAAFVYEISGVKAADGVTSITDPAACRADLIVNSNVLEHIGFPRNLVLDMVKAAPPGGLVYLEVPRESPFGLGRIAKRAAQIGVMSLTRPGLALSVARPATLYMMHEHVNYFSVQCLVHLMSSCGCTVVASGSYAMDNRAGKGDVAWCLGTSAAH